MSAKFAPRGMSVAYIQTIDEGGEDEVSYHHYRRGYLVFRF
jgi:hypothetical protein